MNEHRKAPDMQMDPPNKTVTSREIARLCQVSPATVSRVLNGYSGISSELRKKVLSVCREQNYEVRNYRRTPTFLLVGAAEEILINGEYYYLCLNALAKEFARRNCDCLIVPMDRLEMVKNLNFDAAIGLFDEAAATYWNQHSVMPMIQLNRPRPENCPNSYSIVSDDYDAMKQAMQLLIQRGHRKIGLLSANTKVSIQDEFRHQAFYQVAQEYGSEIRVFCEEYELEKLYAEALGKLIGKGITALICPTEGLGARVLHTLLLFRLRVPEDISLLVWEATDVSQYCNPALTAIGQDFERIASLAADIGLAGKREQINMKREYRIPHLLFDRASVQQI